MSNDSTTRGFTLIELMIVIAIIAIIAAIAIPNLLEARKQANESSAISTMRAIHSASELFSARDPDGDGNKDYPEGLWELQLTGMLELPLDPEVGEYMKSGYVFLYGRSAGGFSWTALAIPYEAYIELYGPSAASDSTPGSLPLAQAIEGDEPEDLGEVSTPVYGSGDRLFLASSRGVIMEHRLDPKVVEILLVDWGSPNEDASEEDVQAFQEAVERFDSGQGEDYSYHEKIEAIGKELIQRLFPTETLRISYDAAGMEGFQWRTIK